MIETKELITKVEFGNDKQATIGVSAKYGTLTLQMLCKEKEIGDSFSDDDIKELPKIQMEFNSIKSVNVLIEALECIKRNYTPPSNTLPLAC